uniref:DNA ligase 1-like n=1 Tax=Cicer arietinum TaxID=3827 RepID=A0A3Q7XH76_CICAR|nr:DNA ligase 1-like [Cicer arietinum]
MHLMPSCPAHVLPPRRNNSLIIYLLTKNEKHSSPFKTLPQNPPTITNDESLNEFPLKSSSLSSSPSPPPLPPPPPSSSSSSSSLSSSSFLNLIELKKRVSLLKNKSSNFNPDFVEWWKKGESVSFMFLSLALDMINEESGRITITEIVCNLLRIVIHATPEDLLSVVYLTTNRIAPSHQGLELGIGKASIVKAFAKACGRTEKHIKEHYKVCLCYF